MILKFGAKVLLFCEICKFGTWEKLGKVILPFSAEATPPVFREDVPGKNLGKCKKVKIER
jgi:hypothetical protein